MTEIRKVPMPDLEGMQSNAMIRRCDRSNGFKLGCLCLSSAVFGTETHFLGRTVPCIGRENGCQGCGIGRRTAWVGYIAATNMDRTRRFLVELTPNCMLVVKRFVELHHTLRGTWCTLERPSKRDTGRVTITVQANGLNLAPAEIPQPFDVEKSLRKIWGLPEDPPDLAQLLESTEARSRIHGLTPSDGFGTVAGNGQSSHSGVHA